MTPEDKLAVRSELGLMTAGQRKINLIWEITQAVIALAVVMVTLFVAAWMVVRGKPEQQLPTIFAVAFGTIVGFYFGRTNHANIGGIRGERYPPYEGR